MQPRLACNRGALPTSARLAGINTPSGLEGERTMGAAGHDGGGTPEHQAQPAAKQSTGPLQGKSTLLLPEAAQVQSLAQPRMHGPKGHCGQLMGGDDKKMWGQAQNKHASQSGCQPCMPGVTVPPCQPGWPTAEPTWAAAYLLKR